MFLSPRGVEWYRWNEGRGGEEERKSRKEEVGMSRRKNSVKPLHA
jgi:hypothetical protein